jgi:hypothetical protein
VDHAGHVRSDDPDPSWSACPGCGVSLPGSAALHGRSLASEACWQLYGEVAGYELAHLASLGRFHQLLVDTYIAQHAGGSSPAIGVAFALIGLRLTLDDGWRGEEVRDAHRYLAESFREWPAFDPPTRRSKTTVFDLALAASPEIYVVTIQRWAADVWASWRDSQDEVLALIDARLPAEVRKRIRSAS